MTPAEYAFEFQKQLAPMVAEEIISPTASTMITQMVGDLLLDFANDAASQIEERYREWELVMDENDKTLYTLGLRHAKDMILLGRIDREE
jgi:hypothetical protein